MQRQGRNEKKRAWRARARSIDFEEGLSVVDGEMERKRERERENRYDYRWFVWVSWYRINAGPKLRKEAEPVRQKVKAARPPLRWPFADVTRSEA